VFSEVKTLAKNSLKASLSDCATMSPDKNRSPMEDLLPQREFTYFQKDLRLTLTLSVSFLSKLFLNCLVSDLRAFLHCLNAERSEGSLEIVYMRIHGLQGTTQNYTAMLT